jgi:Ser/Thr protein kinase RdoA (MazF antagonist)
MDIPVILRRHAGIEPTGTTLPARESIAWLVRRGDQLAVLHRLDPVRWPAEDSDAHGEVAWLHDYLARLARTTFPAPRPLSVDGERSWTIYQDAIWELMSYLPGTVLGWRPQPSLTEVGALLAQFHQASATITPARQRPRAFALDRIVAAPASGQLREWLADLADDLQRIDHAAADRMVIHGDFTAHNVVASGQPARPTGVIDFALAYVESALADVGFGLWRSGRSHQDAIGLDLQRVHDLVSGYTRVHLLPATAADAITVYIRARGIQRATKAHTRGQPPYEIDAQRIRWLSSHRSTLRAAIADAIKT